MLSVRTSEPLKEPAAVGKKLIGSWQDSPGASVPGSEDPLLSNGQSKLPELFRVKFAEILGLFPLEGIGNVSAALPAFSTVIVRGLSGLAEPITVLEKVRLGGSAKSSFTTRLLAVSAT